MAYVLVGDVFSSYTRVYLNQYSNLKEEGRKRYSRAGVGILAVLIRYEEDSRFEVSTGASLSFSFNYSQLEKEVETYLLRGL